MFRIRFLFIVMLVLSSAHLMNAQFTLDGRRPFFDSRTKIYLLPVPEDYFGKPCTLSFVPDDSISWVSQDAWYVTDNMYFRNLKIDRAETQFDDSVDTYADMVYEKAKSRYEEMKREGYYLADASECFYLYELTMNGRA